MADLATVHLFSSSADAHADFLARVRVALFEEAVSTRETIPASPTAEEVALQEFAIRIFNDPVEEAKRMLPALAVKANNAGLIANDGTISATDAQVRSTVAGLMTEFSRYVPDAV